MPSKELLSLDRYAIYSVDKLQKTVLQHYDQFEYYLAMQKFVAFCSEDLGGFYLDVIKDRLYTTAESSFARRSAQTALYHISHSLMRVMAPVLSFTAHELWEVLCKNVDHSLFSDFWYELPSHHLNNDDLHSWEALKMVRGVANKKIEELREEGKIGSYLQAQLTIKANQELTTQILKFKDDLRFIFITSSVLVE